MDVRWESVRNSDSQLKMPSSSVPEVEIDPKKPERNVLSTLGRRPHVNIDFSDLSYSVRVSGLNGKKEILKGVSGNFRSGQLTAIMGSSGAGKSTLMDILAGYVTSGVKGSIKVNGHPRQTKIFNKLTSYIMQDDLVQSHLTVLESMHIAARLKLGDELTNEEKSEIVIPPSPSSSLGFLAETKDNFMTLSIARLQKDLMRKIQWVEHEIHFQVDEILHMLGLRKCRETRCEKLSGGQRKRLSVALELVSNPPAVFIDEPTTGLDTVSTNDMIKLLHKLSRQGRTIICTIHQPSASIFELFDKVYVLSKGKCVYHGSHDQLVPFLSSLGLNCPITHNPADYVIEVIQGENDCNVNALAAEIQNGKVNLETCRKESDEDFPVLSRSYAKENPEKFRFPISFWRQCAILLSRRLKQQWRNPATMWLMIVHHVASGLFLGSIFLGVADDAHRPFDNFKFIISVVVFFMYTHVMCPVLLFPTEVRLLRREYFNRWYSLKSYFAALTLSTIPSHIVLSFAVTAICYVLSGQPLDITRYFLFAIVGFLLGIVSEGWGLTIGSIFSEMNGSIMGPASVVPLLAVSVYGLGFGTAVEPVMRYLMSASYLRYGIVGFTLSLYGFNRSTLYCDYEKRNYCHYKDPVLLMKDLGMEGESFNSQLTALLIFFILHRILAFLCLRYRLTSEFSNRIFNYASKFLRQK